MIRYFLTQIFKCLRQELLPAYLCISVYLTDHHGYLHHIIDRMKSAVFTQRHTWRLIAVIACALTLSSCGPDQGKEGSSETENRSKSNEQVSGSKEKENSSSIGEQVASSGSGDLWKAQAEGGDRIAQFQYSIELEKKGNTSESLKWLRRAAEQGLAEAQFELGKRYLEGEGVEKSADDGIKWLKLSSKQNFRSAVELLKTKFPNQVILTQEEAALAREAFNKGVGHLLGTDGFEKDPDKSIQYFLEAAEIGSVDAQWNLGLLYNEGIGVELNPDEARYWFEKAAKAGHSRAQFNLSLMYMTGRGVERDFTKASELLQLSAENGYIDAAFGLAELYTVGQGVPQDYSKAVEWFEKAAKAGHPRAQSNLGTFYVEGQGVEKNEMEAFKWFKKAADLGEPYGLYNLGYLYETSEQVDRNLIEAYKCYSLAAETLSKLSTDFGLPLDPLFYKARQLRDQLAEKLSGAELKSAIDASSRFIRQKYEENSELLRKNYSREQNSEISEKLNESESSQSSVE